MEPLYQSKIKCICCEFTFMTSRVRPSFKRAVKTDTDFCGYYKPEVNPDFYVVRVCPNCGFASTENGMERLNDQQKKQYHEKSTGKIRIIAVCEARNKQWPATS